MVDYQSYHVSLTNELISVKDRVRNLVTHWGTDGEFKEVALRSVLRRHLPASLLVGRGFVVTNNQSSTQVDVLVIDGNKPCLFRDGDLFIVTPDAVRAAIEVKTRLDNGNAVTEALTKLATVEDLCRGSTGHGRVWTGLFVFEQGAMDAKKLLSSLSASYNTIFRPIQCVSAGKGLFARYWSRGADVDSKERGPVWHAYDLPSVAPSYFVGNLIDWISKFDNESVAFAWFPLLEGKEQHRTHYISPNMPEAKKF